MGIIKQKYNLLTKRIWNSKVYDYAFNFKKACINTEKLRLIEENIDLNRKEIEFNPADKQEIIDLILYQIYEVDKLQIEDLALKCFLLSKDLKKFLEIKLGIKSYLTTGNVYLNKMHFHYESFSKMKKRIENNSFCGAINSHTWLTLENYDIIDATIAPNMWIEYLNSGLDLLKGDYKKILWFSTDIVNKKGMIYEPKIIGYKYFETIHLPVKIYNLYK